MAGKGRHQYSEEKKESAEGEGEKEGHCAGRFLPPRCTRRMKIQIAKSNLLTTGCWATLYGTLWCPKKKKKKKSATYARHQL